tara:strand:+ start:10 stop:213 length:204 start_codon:yes stop_codon:yes gene_type:complete
LEKKVLVNIKRDKNANYLMTTLVNSLILKAGNKKHTASFLRCRGVLQEKKIGQKNANNYSAAKGQQI